MAFYKKGKLGKSPGYHPYTHENMKHVGLCLNKNIKIAVIPSMMKWQVEININKAIHLDSNEYEADEAYKKMYEYYKYYYDKHNKQ